MAKKENKLMRRRLANAYLSTVISISLVLQLVGVAALLLLNAGSVSDYFKESLQISVLMKTEITDEQTMVFQSELDRLPFIKTTNFISREQGEEEMKSMLGEGFLSVFETSPVPSSIDITLEASYVSPDSLSKVSDIIMKNPMVDEVSYQQSLIEALNQNLGKIAASLAIFIALLLFISFVLINNTVRLSVFSRRFTIHTMKLVGATRSFIRRPFLGQAVLQGLLSSFVAILFLVGMLLVLRKEFPPLFEVFQMPLLIAVMGVVVVCGVLLCVVSTYFVVNKLVSFNKDQLYY